MKRKHQQQHKKRATCEICKAAKRNPTGHSKTYCAYGGGPFDGRFNDAILASRAAEKRRRTARQTTAVSTVSPPANEEIVQLHASIGTIGQETKDLEQGLDKCNYELRALFSRLNDKVRTQELRLEAQGTTIKQMQETAITQSNSIQNLIRNTRILREAAGIGLRPSYWLIFFCFGVYYLASLCIIMCMCSHLHCPVACKRCPSTCISCYYPVCIPSCSGGVHIWIHICLAAPSSMHIYIYMWNLCSLEPLRMHISLLHHEYANSHLCSITSMYISLLVAPSTSMLLVQRIQGELAMSRSSVEYTSIYIGLLYRSIFAAPSWVCQMHAAP